MNTYRFDEQQIRAWVRDKVTRAKSVKQICQEASISRATLYNWLNDFPHVETPVMSGKTAGIPLSEEAATEVKRTIKSASKLPVTDLGARYQMIVSSLKKADPDGTISRKLVGELVKRYTITVAQACEIVGIDESVYGYRPRKPEVDDQLVYNEFVRIINEEPSRSFIDCYEIIQTTQPDWTRKQLKRVYREKRLYLLRKRKTRNGYATETELLTEETLLPATAPVRLYRPGATWNLGLVQDTEQQSWVLFILDNEDGTPLNARAGEGEVIYEDVLAFLDIAAEENGSPKKLRLFAKEPFTNREITRWIWDNRVALHNLSLGKPENQMEMEQMEGRVREQISHHTNGDLADNVTSWISSYL